jgi:hypothetical protein
MHVSPLTPASPKTFRMRAKQGAVFGAATTRDAIVATRLKTDSASRQSVRGN